MPFPSRAYPITYAQFQAFIDDPEGLVDDRWWQGLAEPARFRRPFEQAFPYANHPREMVNWYQAIAFCRWFSHRLGGPYALDDVLAWKVRLPTEQEWEKARGGGQADRSQRSRPKQQPPTAPPGAGIARGGRATIPGASVQGTRVLRGLPP
ncbi:MAG: formylglycine-generating enzyme family protein [Anaerolineae bacterium]|nr:formylglycine-generating enzyme family protein [Anaerolineae bacterium]